MADEGSAGLRSHGTHGRLSDKETVNAGRDSCGSCPVDLTLLSVFLHPDQLRGVSEAGRYHTVCHDVSVKGEAFRKRL